MSGLEIVGLTLMAPLAICLVILIAILVVGAVFFIIDECRDSIQNGNAVEFILNTLLILFLIGGVIFIAGANARNISETNSVAPVSTAVELDGK